MKQFKPITKLIIVLLSIGSSYGIQAQTEIRLSNPSFEQGNAAHGKVPSGWYDCGFEQETPMDIHSEDSGFFNVRSVAAEGSQFGGLVARDDGTWEGIGQVLDRPLEAGKWHSFSFSAKMAKFYVSLSRSYSRETNYDQPLVLYLWGSTSKCEQEELLGVSPPLDFEDWTDVTIGFTPSKSYGHIWFEVSYVDPQGPVYNGHVLLDDFDPIKVWTDTVRYKAICVDGDFFAWLDKETVSDSVLLETLFSYAEKASMAGVISSYYEPDIYNIWLSEVLRRESDQAGFRQFIMNKEPRFLLFFREALNSLGLEQEAALLQEGMTLRVKAQTEDLTPEEAVRFDALDQEWKSVEQIQPAQLEFVAGNKDRLIKQFDYCR